MRDDRGVMKAALIVCVLCNMILARDEANRSSVAPLLAGGPTMVASDERSSELAALGKALFFDKMLSRNRTLSCASCHQPTYWFSLSASTAEGVEGSRGNRNVPSLLNVNLYSVFFWDGRASSLEEQVGYPLLNPHEMGLSRHELKRRLGGHPDYMRKFKMLFGDTVEPGLDQTALAIAAFERSLNTGASRFDQFYVAGQPSALSAEAEDGFRLFLKSGCDACHRIDSSYPSFTDGMFHNTGVGFDCEDVDLGRYEITRQLSDVGRFRTPSLRNVALTSPYMHDGSMGTLERVVEFYNRGGVMNKNLDPLMRPLGLKEAEMSAIVAFLQSLTSLDFGTAGVTESSFQR